MDEWQPLWPDKKIDLLEGPLDKRLRVAAADPGRIVSRLWRRYQLDNDTEYEPVHLWVARASELVALAWTSEQKPANTSTRFCIEEACRSQPSDFARLTLTTPTGAMVIEPLLCELHIATLEVLNSGSYMFLRPRRA